MSHLDTISETDIAIVGMSGRFPGARNTSEYWRNLCNGIESVTVLSENELSEAGVPSDLIHDKDYVRAAYMLNDADRFDASFFGYAPREARSIDPQQRVLLECAWQAMEHAGYGAGTCRTTGVYVGSSLNTYLLFTGLAEQFKTDPVLTLMSNDKDFLATRIGYKLQLEGPCLTIQTACSTSLVAVHVACQSILAGECDMALAGGVCVKVPLVSGYVYREGGMLSRDGHCRPFDAGATGTIFGSGAGIVVLKRYADAIADRDTIYAVIKGSAINNDGGRKASYTAPSVNGLADVISQAMDFAQVSADDIGYVECHGTGTALGDPIEVHALTKAFRASTSRENFSALASVKSNIGHLEAASGVAGLIKAACCLHQKYLPASLHFKSPNPSLGLDGSPFFVNAEGHSWSNTHGNRTAIVNSLGVGGTNASVVLGEAPAKETHQSSRKWHWLPVSAKSAATLPKMCTELLEHLSEDAELKSADTAYTLHEGRTHFTNRAVVLVGPDGVYKMHADATIAQPRSVVFVIGNEINSDLAELLRQQEPQLSASGLISHALIKLWQDWGVTPVTILGESSETGQSAELLCRSALDCYPNAIFLPIGSGAVFIDVLSRLIGQSTAQVLLRPLEKLGTVPVLLAQSADLWRLGVSVKGSALYKGEERNRIPLPNYPFQGDRHWFTPTPTAHRDRQSANMLQADALARFVTQSKAVATM